MSDIWNLSALCRCCHLDGNFKSLELPFMHQNEVEVYSMLLKETLGISILKPPGNMSYSICDVCIYKLRETNKFRRQILMCEEKFHEYLQNEEALNPHKEIKLEIEPSGNSDIELQPDDGIRLKIETHYDSDDDGNHLDMDECSDGVKREHVKDELDTKEQIEESCQTKDKKTRTRTTRKCSKLKKPQKAKPVKKEKNSVKEKFPCQQCESSFVSRKALGKHVRREHSVVPLSTPYSCALCPQQFPLIADIYRHVSTHGADQVKCRFCDKYFRLARTQLCHENTAHICQEQFICNICNKQFSYKSTLRKHILWHNGLSKRAFCELCGKGFNDNGNLRIHVETVHLKLRKYPCTKCDKTFTLNKHLKRHTDIQHDGQKLYVCKKCRQSYSDHKSLLMHKLKHEITDGTNLKDSKPLYRCKVCSKLFDHRGQFKAHVLIHNKDGTSPNICHICGRGFSCKYSLNRHVDNHNGLRLFSCDICQKRFTQKALVARHMKSVHDGVKKERVKCPICKSYVRDMETHTKRHVVRPFACDLCPKSYPEKNALNRHVKQTHLGIFKHSCSVCNTNYKTAKLLARHMTKQHQTLGYDDIHATQLPVEVYIK